MIKIKFYEYSDSVVIKFEKSDSDEIKELVQKQVRTLEAIVTVLQQNR